MRVWLKTSVIALGFSLGIATFPVAHGEMDKDMTVIMQDDLVAADPEKIKWVSNKSTPRGMMLVMVYGDPSKPGPYIFRARMPAGYKLPPHRHPDERVVTILKGTYWSGVGERFDPMKMNEFRAGAFYVTKANVPHYAWARTDVIIQEQGMGPVENGIAYVNPEDDPRQND